MKVITYLGFTLLSLLIQFGVMDFIQGNIKSGSNFDITQQSQKETLQDMFKNISNKPHALYYRQIKLQKEPATFSKALSQIFEESTMSNAVETSTDISSTTILDILYDENATDLSTTEKVFATEIDNVTEITFFDKNNTSTLLHIPPKDRSAKYCGCNLLYNVCDINCCCDPVCTQMDLKIFECGETRNTDVTSKHNDGCISYLAHNTYREFTMVDNLFCVVRTNLPAKRTITTYNEAAILQNYKWMNFEKPRMIYEFTKTLYKQNDPIWILKNGTVYYLDFPSPMVNSYCTDRKPITFLKVQRTKCSVKLNDLEMFHIKTSEEAMVISATESTFNASSMNCSSAHCVNFTMLACENGVCQNYNHTLHEASCTETICYHLALKVQYEFYYQEAKIINATIKLNLENISNILPFMTQEIHVNFFMANKSIDQIVELSGNPGYIHNLPIIVSYTGRNFSNDYFNNTLFKRSRLMYPENKNGQCIVSNTSQNVVLFGLNKRTKCRYVYSNVVTKTNNNACKIIQENINELLGLNKIISISPFGNPYNISDDNWISLAMEKDQESIVFGKYNENISKLHCHNFINQITVIFIVASVDEASYEGQNKILSVKYVTTPKNISFNIDEITTVISVDITFIDITKPSFIEFAARPQLNIHLPKDFFFPFPPNTSCILSNAYLITMYCCILILFTNKITFE